jgi:hypothetical protein
MSGVAGAFVVLSALAGVLEHGPRAYAALGLVVAFLSLTLCHALYHAVYDGSRWQQLAEERRQERERLRQQELLRERQQQQRERLRQQGLLLHQRVGYSVVRWTTIGAVIGAVVVVGMLCAALFTLSQLIGIGLVIGTLGLVAFIARG